MDKQENILATVHFVDVSDKIGLGGIRQASTVVSGDYDSDGDEDLFISHWSDQDQSSKQSMFTNNNGVFQDISVIAGIKHDGRDITALTADYDNDGFLDLLFINNSFNYEIPIIVYTCFLSWKDKCCRIDLFYHCWPYNFISNR